MTLQLQQEIKKVKVEVMNLKLRQDFYNKCRYCLVQLTTKIGKLSGDTLSRLDTKWSFSPRLTLR